MLQQARLEIIALVRCDTQRRDKPSNPHRVEGTDDRICFVIFRGTYSFLSASKSVHTVSSPVLDYPPSRSYIIQARECSETFSLLSRWQQHNRS
ncbi:hypothetical protein J6590_097122 [Homalodisca vitripennis]|nr:hypothetical protein J6590_097122 [Homalodisca vitripennis]